MLERSRLTVEYVKVPIRERISGLDVNPTSYTVSYAVVKTTVRPANGDFTATTWETDATGTVTSYGALVLIDGPTLGPGDYTVWVKVDTGAIEVVKEPSGPLRIT